MKVFLVGLFALLVVGVCVFTVLALLSQQEPKHLGLKDRKLRACSDAPNCVCSEDLMKGDKVHFIQPFPANPDTWKSLQQSIVQQGGTLNKVEKYYLHATFSSPIFHYVDDVECRWDEAEAVIHIRSASRVGHSDLGVNRQRVEALRQNL
ncbi:MAG: DUF1499 domain-containing protein [Mariprofundaceae bacterium]|nr:DUF1499 domain-containing protein [Mariprofundaceae bacterium]